MTGDHLICCNSKPVAIRPALPQEDPQGGLVAERLCRNATRTTGSFMKVERHEVGPRMSQIVIHGDTVYLAGIVAQNSGGKSVTEQTREILAIIEDHFASLPGIEAAP